MKNLIETSVVSYGTGTWDKTETDKPRMDESKIFQGEPSDECPQEEYDVCPSPQSYGGTTAYKVSVKQ
jgi:hypothetical protein